MSEELAYSFHLGSDKNKSKLAKKVALYLFNVLCKTNCVKFAKTCEM